MAATKMRIIGALCLNNPQFKFNQINLYFYIRKESFPFGLFYWQIHNNNPDLIHWIQGNLMDINQLIIQLDVCNKSMKWLNCLITCYMNPSANKFPIQIWMKFSVDWIQIEGNI